MRRVAMCVAVVGVGLVAASAAVAVAQEAQPNARPSLAGRLINELALTEEQTAKVKDLEAQRRERAQAAGQDAAKRREAWTWFRTEVRKLLNEEQAKKFDAMPGFRRRGVPRDFVSRWQEPLALTEDQKAKIRALAPVLKQRREEAAGDRAKLREVSQWYQNEVRATLTGAQREKYDAAVRRARTGLSAVLAVDYALRNLDLTEAQRKQIAAFRKTRDAKVKAAYDVYSGALRAVLTPEQVKNFEANLKRARRPAVRQQRPGRRGARGTGQAGASGE